MFDRAGEVVDQDGRCGRGDDGVRPDASFEARASASRLSSTTSGTPSKTIRGAAQCAPRHACAGTTRHARDAPASASSADSMPNARQRLPASSRISPSASASSSSNCVGGARLDVDHGDVVAGIGEGHGDAAAHAAGAEAGDRGARRSSVESPRAAGVCSAVAIEMAEPEARQRAAARAKNPRRRSRRRWRERRAPAASRRRPARATETRNDRPSAQILAHVAMLGQHDLLAPVAGIGQAVVRAAAVHPLLAFAGVVMRQRKMRRAIAERLAHRDAFGVERVGDAADRGLRAFLVDVPALEMLDRRRHSSRSAADG